MTDNSTDVQMWDCPAPDCSYSTAGTAEFAEHVNTDHAGEFQRGDWPDTGAGRKKRTPDDDSDGNDLEK